MLRGRVQMNERAKSVCRKSVLALYLVNFGITSWSIRREYLSMKRLCRMLRDVGVSHTTLADADDMSGGAFSSSVGVLRIPTTMLKVQI